jgi:hypothetical protein
VIDMVTASGQRTTTAVWRVPRTRGATSGTLLVLLGIWGGLIPFIGPHFNYAYTPATTWTMTSGRLWLEVLPAAATVLGGLILLASTSRVVSVWAGWLAALGGAWFIVGPTLSSLWSGGQLQLGVPSAGNPVGNAVIAIGFFYGLGAVILFLAAVALGRLTVVGVRDHKAALAAESTPSPSPSASTPSTPDPSLDAPTTTLNRPDTPTSTYYDTPYSPSPRTPTSTDPPRDDPTRPGTHRRDPD